MPAAARPREAARVGLACALLVTTIASCSLFTSLDGLEGGDGGASAPDAAVDANADAPLGDAAAPSDARADAGAIDAGSWSFVGNDAKTSSTVPIVVTSSVDVRVGDLVVVGCDTGNTGGVIALDGFSATALPLTVVGPFDDGVGYEAQIAWGIVTQALTTTLQVRATPASSVGFIDCSVNVYRGGAPITAQVDSVKTTGPDDSGLVSCGPINTAPGGVAYYIAARTTCAGMPLDPAFRQRTGINGNPNGDSVPTSGAVIQTQLDACNGSTSAWICLMLSLPP